MKTVFDETQVVKVKYRHYRVVSDNVRLPHDIMLNPALITMGSYMPEVDKLNARGGLTVAEVIMQDGTTHFGVASCSLHDNFNKAIGRKRAYGRAVTGKVMPVDNSLTNVVGIPEFVKDILKS